jgi:phospholipid/cholesterol/gamma-HCH transport system substrate-binding protein
MKNKKYEIMVGLVTIIGIVILFLSIIWGKGLSNSVEYTPITIWFKDVNSLREGDKIFVKGVQIGEIVALELTEDHVVVKGKVETTLKLNSDASALIVNKELMGGRIVILESGSSGEPLKESDVIIGKEGAGITEMLAKAGGMVEDLGGLVKRTDSVMLKLKNIMPEKKLDITIGELTSEFKGLSGSVGRNVNKLSAELNVTIKKIESVMDTLAIAAQDGKSGMKDFKEITPQIKKSMSKLDTLLTESNYLMNALKKEESSLGKMIYDRKIYDELNTTVLRLDSLILQIKKEGVKTNIDLW